MGVKVACRCGVQVVCSKGLPGTHLRGSQQEQRGSLPARQLAGSRQGLRGSQPGWRLVGSRQGLRGSQRGWRKLLGRRQELQRSCLQLRGC